MNRSPALWLPILMGCSAGSGDASPDAAPTAAFLSPLDEDQYAEGVPVGEFGSSSQSLVLTDTEVSDNSSIDGFSASEVWGTIMTCQGSSDVSAGFWNQATGLYLAFGSALSSDGCDWGTGDLDNDRCDVGGAAPTC